jgi:hypothetical protein
MIFLERHSGGDDLPAVTSYSVSVVMLRGKINYSWKHSCGRWSMRVGMTVDYDLFVVAFLGDDLSVMAVW